MAHSKTIQNTFSEPWNKSDIMLVIIGKESEEIKDKKHQGKKQLQRGQFHVHRSILCMQSPVFEAMLNGDFKEATQSTIELKNKEYLPMLQFLKLLYPPNMIEGDKVVISDHNVFQILEIADEFQAQCVIKQCVDELEITSQNVLKVLPYAKRWHQSALPKLTDVVNRSVSATRFKKFCSEVKDDHDPTKTTEMLWSKIYFLEKAAGNRHEIISALLYSFAWQLYKDDQQKVSPSHTRPPDSLKDFTKVTSDEYVLKEYEKKILNKIPSIFLPSESACKDVLTRQTLTTHGQFGFGTYGKISLKFLLEGDDILTASKEQ